MQKDYKNDFNQPLKMTDEDDKNFDKVDECHICSKKYIDKDIRVRDQVIVK